jgi:hypothetical protein
MYPTPDPVPSASTIDTVGNSKTFLTALTSLKTLSSHNTAWSRPNSYSNQPKPHRQRLQPLSQDHVSQVAGGGMNQGD